MELAKKYSFLFVSAAFGGIQTFFENLQKVTSVTEDIDSVWMTIERQPKELIARIPPFSLNATLRCGLAAWLRIRALEKSGRKFDAAFFNHLVPVFFLRQFRKRVPTVISVDVTPTLLDSLGSWYGLRPPSRRSLIEKLKHKLTRAVYLDAAYLLPWSNWVRDSLVADYGIEEKKIKVLSPGVNLQKWTRPEGSRVGRPQDGLASEGAQEKIKVLFVGQEFQRKGGDLLLKVAERQEFQNFEFHFVTNNFSGSHGENVFVHPNVQPNSDALIALYCEADLLVLPTRADTYGLVLLEAMAMGLPVLATRVGGIGELVTDGVNGYTIPVDDEEALAERLRLLKNAELRLRLGQHGRQLAESRFNLRTTADAIVGCLKEAADRKRR